MLSAADGNLSFRVSDDKILITPTSRPKAFIDDSEIAVITLDNQILHGSPSSERLMHLEVYKKSPLAKCVVHAHPPTAIAWSIAHPNLKQLPSESLSEVILAAGRIPFIPYSRPGTLEMGTVIHPYLPEHRVVILSRHGALSWGESIEEAYMGMERIEHSAVILKTAMDLGGIESLYANEVNELYKLREKIGPKTL